MVQRNWGRREDVVAAVADAVPLADAQAVVADFAMTVESDLADGERDAMMARFGNDVAVAVVVAWWNCNFVDHKLEHARWVGSTASYIRGDNAVAQVSEPRCGGPWQNMAPIDKESS